MPRKKKPETRVVEISYEHLEAAITNHLQTFGIVKRSEEVLWTDIDIALNERGLIDIEIGVGPADQLSLPFGGEPFGR